jgi:hypothetical protein
MPNRQQGTARSGVCAVPCAVRATGPGGNQAVHQARIICYQGAIRRIEARSIARSRHQAIRRNRRPRGTRRYSRLQSRQQSGGASGVNSGNRPARARGRRSRRGPGAVTGTRPMRNHAASVWRGTRLARSRHRRSQARRAISYQARVGIQAIM